MFTHIYTDTHTHTNPHTCSEQSLRILMWNASYVQKHTIKTDRKRNEKMWRCEDVRMRRCEDLKMWSEDVKMFDRPPLLEEPFAQTLSGKTGTGWTLQEAKVFVRNYRVLKFLEMFLSLKKTDVMLGPVRHRQAAPGSEWIGKAPHNVAKWSVWNSINSAIHLLGIS